MIVLAAAMLLAAVSRADPAPMHAWRSLLDENAAAWRGWKSTTFPEGWQVAADTISKEGEVDDLVTRDKFDDFELELEWKVGKGGNSGIFYRGTRSTNTSTGARPSISSSTTPTRPTDATA